MGLTDAVNAVHASHGGGSSYPSASLRAWRWDVALATLTTAIAGAALTTALVGSQRQDLLAGLSGTYTVYGTGTLIYSAWGLAQAKRRARACAETGSGCPVR